MDNKDRGTMNIPVVSKLPETPTGEYPYVSLGELDEKGSVYSAFTLIADRANKYIGAVEDDEAYRPMANHYVYALGFFYNVITYVFAEQAGKVPPNEIYRYSLRMWGFEIQGNELVFLPQVLDWVLSEEPPKKIEQYVGNIFDEDGDRQSLSDHRTHVRDMVDAEILYYIYDHYTKRSEVALVGPHLKGNLLLQHISEHPLFRRLHEIEDRGSGVITLAQLVETPEIIERAENQQISLGDMVDPPTSVECLRGDSEYEVAVLNQTADLLDEAISTVTSLANKGEFDIELANHLVFSLFAVELLKSRISESSSPSIDSERVLNMLGFRRNGAQLFLETGADSLIRLSNLGPESIEENVLSGMGNLPSAWWLTKIFGDSSRRLRPAYLTTLLRVLGFNQSHFDDLHPWPPYDFTEVFSDDLCRHSPFEITPYNICEIFSTLRSSDISLDPSETKAVGWTTEELAQLEGSNYTELMRLIVTDTAKLISEGTIEALDGILPTDGARRQILQDPYFPGSEAWVKLTNQFIENNPDPDLLRFLGFDFDEASGTYTFDPTISILAILGIPPSIIVNMISEDSISFGRSLALYAGQSQINYEHYLAHLSLVAN